MTVWTATTDRRLLLVLGVALALWLLHPPRQLRPAGDAEGVVEITFMGPSGAHATAMADVIRAYERQSAAEHAKDPSRPRVRVVTGQNAARDQTADPTRFMVSVAGGSPPDVILFDRFAIGEWAARGVFEPLDPYLDADRRAGRADAVSATDYYPSTWNEASYDARLFGIPGTNDARALYYNKDLLVRAGLVDAQGQAKPPATWEELRDYARRLTERNADGRLRTVGFAPNFGNSWLYLFGFLNDARFLSDDGTRVTLAAPRVEEALRYMKSVYDDAGGYEAVQAFQAGFQTEALDPFIQGKVAMKIDGNESLRQIAQYGRDVNFGVAPPPRPAALAAGGPVTWSGGWALAMPSNGRKKQAAWDFIRFVAGDAAYRVQMESGRQIAEAEGRVYLPSQYPKPAINRLALEQYVTGNADVPERFQTAMQTFNDLLPNARFRPVTPVGQLLWNEQIRAMETALYGRLTPAESLEQSQAIVQRALDVTLNPPAGTPIRSWSWFYAFYALLVAVFAAVVGLRFFRWSAVDGLQRKQWIGGLVCASPWLIGFLIFGGGPMLFSLIISFCDYDILNPPRFVGLANYRTMAGGDNLLPAAIWNTAYMVVGVPLGMAVGLALALLLNQKARGIALWRTLFYLPAVVPMVVSSVLWVWILNPQGGLINLILDGVGIEGPRWLQSAQWSKPSLILMGLWTAGSGMIVWLAGLNGISPSLYEAASIDGANRWRQFVSITLPQLTPYIFFNMIMGLIGTLQIFGQAFVMTGGGPENSTLFYVYHLFNYAFRYGQMGYASALAWGLFAVVLGLTAFQLRLSRRWVHYGDQA